MENLVGQTLTRYQITALLGEGGMGAVYRARDLTLQRDVALKVLHPHFARQADFQERFLQEARTAARLDHPSIVQVHDFGQDRGLLYIVMEFIPGDNLDRMLRKMRQQNKAILLGETLKLIRQLALALDYAHRQGVYHRDIKPGNIMIEPEPTGGLPYRPVLTDLGLAKLASGGVITQDGVSMGTPAYMSPEQAMGQATDARSDVYSLGILLFELCTGRLPFPAKSLSEAMRYHAQTPPPAPRSIRPDLPEAVEQIILKCLEKQPAKRYLSGAALAEALESVDRALAGQPSETRPNTVSLLTQYQPSAPVGMPLPNDKTPAQVDSVQVLNADGSSQTTALKPTGMVIGRDPLCDLPINDPKASRQHARIEFDGTDYRITDLNSTNGVFLGNQRIPPNQAQRWTADKPVRIGETWFRLLRPGQTPATLPTASATTVAQGARPPAPYSGSGAPFSLSADRPSLTIEPGQPAALSLTLTNHAAAPLQISLSLTGIPPDWVSAPARPLSLLAGQTQQVLINLHPPRSSRTRAGRYTLVVTAISQPGPAGPAQTAEARLTLTLAPYLEFSAEVYPPRLRDGEIGRLTIHNQSNTPETFSLSWTAAADDLDFTPAQLQLTVPEGQDAIAEFRAEQRRTRWFGGTKTHPYTAQVTPIGAGAGRPYLIQAEATTQAALPGWVLPLSLVLCLLLVAAAGLLLGSLGIFGGGSFIADQSATRTAALSATALAQVQATDSAATATALALENANQATRSAATATATWLLADDDRDGLTNQQELQLGTLTNDRDTDKDGLDDGDEVNLYKTDPLKPDTDGDGIKDGEEVARGLNPLNRDTDGDGLPDNMDPDPLFTSTPTPNVPLTQAAILQQTAAAQGTAFAAQQTAIALQATAQAGATITAAAATSQSATLTAAAARRLAYIYATDPATAQDFQALLVVEGYQVDLIPQPNILITNFSPYKLILVGYDTGNGANWGDPGGAQAVYLASSGIPLLGIGEGGYAFFGKLGLLIGHPKGAHGSYTEVSVVNPASPLWNTPNNIAIPPSQIVQLYSAPVNAAVIYYPAIVMGTEPLGAIPSDPDYYPLITQVGGYLLWGFDGRPNQMTGRGQRVFVNAVDFLIP